MTGMTGHLFSLKHVVLWLLHSRANQPQLVGTLPCLHTATNHQVFSFVQNKLIQQVLDVQRIQPIDAGYVVYTADTRCVVYTAGSE